MIDPESSVDPVGVSPRTLRQFAAVWLGVLVALFTLGAYGRGAPGLAAWTSLAAGVLVGVLGLVRPAAIRPLWLASMALTQPVGHVVSIVLLAAVYWGARAGPRPAPAQGPGGRDLLARGAAAPGRAGLSAAVPSAVGGRSVTSSSSPESDDTTRTSREAGGDARALLRGGGNASIFGELLHFLRVSRKWWLAPVLLSLLVLGAVLVLGSTAVAPFIYALF